MAGLDRCERLCESIDKFCDYAAEIETCEPWEEERRPASCAAANALKTLARFLCQE